MNFFSYAKTAKDLSARLHDQMNTPMETAIHWVEHVAKFKGASHLRSAGLDLTYIAYYNLDCWAFILSVCVLTIFAAYKLIKSVYKSLLSKISYANIKSKAE